MHNIKDEYAHLNPNINEKYIFETLVTPLKF